MGETMSGNAHEYDASFSPVRHKTQGIEFKVNEDLIYDVDITLDQDIYSKLITPSVPTGTYHARLYVVDGSPEAAYVELYIGGEWVRQFITSMHMKQPVVRNLVKSRIHYLRQMIDKVSQPYVAEINELISNCKHLPEHVTKIPKSNTGNYDPSSDEYWYECECDSCGKRWHEPQ